MLWSKAVINFKREMRRVKSLILFSGSSTATQILVGPQELRTIDSTIADDIFAGRLTFAGRHIDVNINGSKHYSIFDAPPPSLAFARELHGFGWLRHIRGSHAQSMPETARAIIDDWIKTYGQNASGFAMQPSVLSRRLISLVSLAPVLLQGAEHEFYHGFMASLSFQASLLDKELKLGLPPEERLSAWIAINYFAQCSNVSAKFHANSEAGLIKTLGAEILPDGGHISRNPHVLLELVLDLLPLQQVFVARNRVVPELIPEVVGKMLGMLRLLRHSDGNIGAFNGKGASETGLLARILPYLNVANPPIFDANYSGYQRLEKGKSVVLVDAGRAPPSKYSSRAHAGCLSFEFSTGLNKVIVNCGVPILGSQEQVFAARQTEAHSVLTINNVSSSQFAKATSKGLDSARDITQGPVNLSYGRQIIEDGDMLIARHDGYVLNFGLVYQRSFWLDKTGLRLEGQDMLQANPEASVGIKAKIKSLPSNLPFALRFHLHPLVKPELCDDKTAVMLHLTNKEMWKFTASGNLLEIDNSVYFATAQGQQKTSQIIVSGRASINTKIDWVLERV